MNLKVISEQLQKMIPPGLLDSFAQRFKNGAPATHTSSLRLACDLGKTKLVFLEVLKTGEEVQVTRFLKIPRPEEGGDVPALLKQAQTEGGFQTSKIRISVKGQGVIIRFVQFPQMSDEELRGAITFEAEKYIPFKSEEVIVDYHVLEREIQTVSGKVMNILLVAVKRDEIYPLIQQYQDAGFQVELIDTDALAFLNAMEFLYPEDFQKNTGILDFGSEISTLGIIRGGKPQFIRDIAFGNQDLVKRLKRKTKVPFEEVLKQLWQASANPPAELEQALSDSLEPLSADLKVSLDFYSDQMQVAEPLQKIFISGAIGAYPVVSQMFAKIFGFEFAMIDILPKVKIAETLKREEVTQMSPIFPIALGLCLRDL
ncbi:MAG: type IV pilus assembly protein PilM [Candidatus Omnitrophica bacterium]|nr:type IV pilus assembly protein PilM [Candidatus Omnitrophota bacterium]